MRIAAISWAFQVQGLSPTQKLVLLALADHANEDAECWPSVHRISMRTALRERAVRSAIKALAESGLVSVRRRDGGTSRYRLAVGVQSRSAPRAVHAGPLRETLGEGASDAGGEVRDVQGRGALRAPKPSRNRQSGHRVEAASFVFPDEIRGSVPKAVYDRTLEELRVGDLKFPDLPRVVVELLEEGSEPESIYAAARDIDRRGVERMRTGSYLAAIVRAARARWGCSQA